MKNVIRLFALVCVMMLAACGSSNTPTATAEKAAECLKSQDFEGFVDMLYVEADKRGTEKYQQEKEQLAAMMKDKYQQSVDAKKGGISGYEVLSEEVDEEAGTAVVKIKTTYGDGSTDESSMKLKKDEEGNWRVVFGK